MLVRLTFIFISLLLPAAAFSHASLGFASQIAPVPNTVAFAPKAGVAVFHVSMKDGVFSPAKIHIKENEDFRLVVENAGSWPAEFENLILRVEKIIPPRQSHTFKLGKLDKGVYKFTDDFNPSSQEFEIVVS